MKKIKSFLGLEGKPFVSYRKATENAEQRLTRAKLELVKSMEDLSEKLDAEAIYVEKTIEAATTMVQSILTAIEADKSHRNSLGVQKTKLSDKLRKFRKELPF